MQLSSIVKVKHYRPSIGFSDHDADQSGRMVRKELSEVIDKWNLQPRVERDVRGRVSKKKQTHSYLAYQRVFKRNQWHPEDIVELHKHLAIGLEQVAQGKFDALQELKDAHKRSEIDAVQCDSLVAFVGESLKDVQNDRVWCLTQLLDLIIHLEQQPELWEKAELVQELN